MQTFKALILRERDVPPSIETLPVGDLPAGNVLIQVSYSAINYKDALAVTHSAPIVRSLPMIPGVDLVGTVLESGVPDFLVKTKVVLTGWGIGERHWGGYSQLARANAEWLVPLPEALTELQSMTIGTAGLTAMLCVMVLEMNGLSEGSNVLVTGAAGGVGSFAIALLSRSGYQVTASSSRHESLGDYLQRLGAAEVMGRLDPIEAALGKQQWAGAIDTVGGSTLATLLKQITYGGSVAACGLAGGSDLLTTVYPFILRGISLLGVDSVMCPIPKRLAAWNRIASLLNEEILDRILEQVISLEEILPVSRRVLEGDVRGRVVVDIRNEN